MVFQQVVMNHKLLFSLAYMTKTFSVSVGWCGLRSGRQPVFPEEVGVLFTSSHLGLRETPPWWDVMDYGSSGLCVPSNTFLQPEASSSAALPEMP